MYCEKRLEQDELLGFKIVPGPAISKDSFAGQTEADWSAVYVQLTVDRAISYLSNHFDRGHASATLVSLHACGPLKCLIIDDPRISDGTVSEKEKAGLVRRTVQDHTGLALNKGPLMKSFGDALPGAFLVLPDDALHHELAMPHSLFTDPGDTAWIRATPLYTFDVVPERPWMVKNCQGLQLTRETREDFRLLAKTVHQLIEHNTAEWIR